MLFVGQPNILLITCTRSVIYKKERWSAAVGLLKFSGLRPQEGLTLKFREGPTEQAFPYRKCLPPKL